MEERRVVTAAGAVTLIEAGADAGGPPLVLLHGFAGTSRSFAGAVARLSATRRVIAPDLPGFGGSDPLGPAPHPSDFGGWALAVLVALEIDRADLLGHATGGLAAAALRAMAPEWVGRLVLSAPQRGRGIAQPTPLPRGMTGPRDELGRIGAPAFAAAYAGMLCAPGASAEVRNDVRRELTRLRPEGLAGAVELLGRADLLDLLRGGAPVAGVIAGEQDALTPFAEHQQLAAALRAPLIALPEVGYAAYLEDLEAWCAAVELLLR